MSCWLGLCFILKSSLTLFWGHIIVIINIYGWTVFTICFLCSIYILFKHHFHISFFRSIVCLSFFVLFSCLHLSWHLFWPLTSEHSVVRVISTIILELYIYIYINIFSSSTIKCVSQWENFDLSECIKKQTVWLLPDKHFLPNPFLVHVFHIILVLSFIELVDDEHTSIHRRVLRIRARQTNFSWTRSFTVKSFKMHITNRIVFEAVGFCHPQSDPWWRKRSLLVMTKTEASSSRGGRL